MAEVKTFDLPSSWEWTTIGDISYVKREQIDPKQSPKTYFNYLSIENVESHSGKLVNFLPTRGNEIGSSKIKFSTSDVLYSKLRPYLNKVHLPDFDGVSATDLIPIRPKEGIPREYIAYYLRMRKIAEYLNSRVHGIQLPRVSVDDLLATPIPLAPQQEQRRIIRKLNEIIMENATVVKELVQIPIITGKLINSIRTAAFRGKLLQRQRSSAPVDVLQEVTREKRNLLRGRTKSKIDKGPSDEVIEPIASGPWEIPSEWVWVRLSDICIEPETADPAREPKKEITYVDISAIDNKKNTISGVKRIAGKNSPTRARQKIALNDILFSMVRTYLKNIAIVQEDYNNPFCSTGFCVMRVAKPIEPYFVFQYVLTDYFINSITPQQSGIMYPAAKESDIMNQPIPIPPIRDQQLIVQGLQDINSDLIATETSVLQATRLNKTVLEAILSKAYRGELVPQDSNEEPASVMLERIKDKSGVDNRRYLR